jgi:hypothetical protein
MIILPLAMIAWGLYCILRGVLWLRTWGPIEREECGEAPYLLVNAALVFLGLYALCILLPVKAGPVVMYLRWVFDAGTRPAQPDFFLRLIPGYALIVVALLPLRPPRRR